MSMLEKACKAAWDAREELMPARTRQPWPEGTPVARTTAGVMVLAAFNAIREPDEGMIEARAVGFAGDAWANWQAMIDHITREGRG